jgi:hypothetical protein
VDDDEDGGEDDDDRWLVALLYLVCCWSVEKAMASSSAPPRRRPWEGPYDRAVVPWVAAAAAGAGRRSRPGIPASPPDHDRLGAWARSVPRWCYLDRLEEWLLLSAQSGSGPGPPEGDPSRRRHPSEWMTLQDWSGGG